LQVAAYGKYALTHLSTKPIIHGCTDRDGKTKVTDPSTIAPTIAVAGVVVAALIAYTASKKALYVNSVTVERTKWIGSLRINISEICKESRIFNFKLELDHNFKNSDEYKTHVSTISGLMSIIRLQLNPNGKIDGNVLTLIRGLPIRAEMLSSAQLMIYEDLLIRHSQWLLKAEWEKVKLEASDVCKARKIKAGIEDIGRSYDEFCRRDGQIPAAAAP
jgi:hypothetical protein